MSAEELSGREIEVLLAAAAGKRNREISAELYVSQETVKSHLSTIYRKLGISGRHELAGYLAADEQLRNRVGHPVT